MNFRRLREAKGFFPQTASKVHLSISANDMDVFLHLHFPIDGSRSFKCCRKRQLRIKAFDPLQVHLIDSLRAAAYVKNFGLKILLCCVRFHFSNFQILVSIVWLRFLCVACCLIHTVFCRCLIPLNC